MLLRYHVVSVRGYRTEIAAVGLSADLSLGWTGGISEAVKERFAAACACLPVGEGTSSHYHV